MPPTQAQILFSKICALGATPDELCLAELRARASPAATFEAFKNGTVATAAYCEMHDLAEAFYAALHLDNLVALKPGHDPREVASYTDGPDMAVGLEALQTLGVLQFQGASTLEQRRRHIWHTLIHVVCAQCVKPELMVEVPLQDGTRIPLGGRPEIIARLEAHREEVLDYFLKPISKAEGALANKRILTMMHKEMSPECDASFHNPVDWEHRSDPRKIYLSMRVHGLTSASDLDVNLNRCIVRYHKVKVSERASTKVPDAGHAHIDANLNNVAGSAMGCKAALTPSAFAALLGCGPKTWDFLKQEFRATFATAAEGHKMLNMPTLEADTLQIQDLAKVCLSLAPGAMVIWLSSAVHSVAAAGKGWEFGSWSLWAQLHATNGQDRENVVTCLSTGSMPDVYPSGYEKKKGELGTITGRDGAPARTFNYLSWDNYLNKLDDHPCSEPLRLDANGEPHLQITKAGKRVPRWRPPRCPPSVLASLREFEANMSHTTRAMLGLPHDAAQAQISVEAGSVPVQTNANDEDDLIETGTSFEPPGVQRPGSRARKQSPPDVGEKRPREEDTCAICMQGERDAVFVPCGHLVACMGCAQVWSQTCPICKQAVGRVQRVFRP